MSDFAPSHYHSVIVGGGPAGTGSLVYGAWSGRLPQLINRGLAIVEEGPSLGAGRLDRYAINSNSTGATFLECLEHGISSEFLPRTLSSPLRGELETYRNEVLPLGLASALLRSIGDDLLAATKQSALSHAYLDTRAESVRMLGPSRFAVQLKSNAAQAQSPTITANRVLIAVGGNAQIAAASGAMLAHSCGRHGASSLPMMMSSEELLSEAGRSGVEAWLDGFDRPQVVVIGGAHSALSSVWLLLERMHGDFSFDIGSIRLLHRSPFKLFYESVEEAVADGFDTFAAEDVGSKGQVFPIGGLRGDAKALFRRIVGLDPRREKRVSLGPLPNTQSAWDALPLDWSQLALVVFANGYTQPRLPIFNASGAPIGLLGHFTERFVDQSSRLLDAFGAPIPGLFATGLTSGFSPVEMLSGEASYAGKENSVWLSQHQLGELLFNALAA